MQTQLICSDIDGTLLNKDRALSQKTISVIKDLAHIPFILISSRMPQAMHHLQSELDILDLPLICYNGGLIMQGSEILHSSEIKIASATDLAHFCSNTSIHTSLYHAEEWYVAEMDFWANRESSNTKVMPQVQTLETTLNTWDQENKGAHKIMCMGNPEEIDQLEIYINAKHAEEIIAYRSKDTYLEISPRIVSKKTALQRLIEIQYPSLTLANVMAFGDNFNDIDMLAAVGVGVAVANAIDEVLAITNVTTKTNKEDGVALFLEAQLLQGKLKKSA